MMNLTVVQKAWTRHEMKCVLLCHLDAAESVWKVVAKLMAVKVKSWRTCQSTRGPARTIAKSLALATAARLTIRSCSVIGRALLVGTPHILKTPSKLQEDQLKHMLLLQPFPSHANALCTSSKHCGAEQCGGSFVPVNEADDLHHTEAKLVRPMCPVSAIHVKQQAGFRIGLHKVIACCQFYRILIGHFFWGFACTCAVPYSARRHSFGINFVDLVLLLIET
eukprot:SM000101S09278  [mRNA]  locus=s101:335156:341285:+ [translate_table: standard]